MGVDVVDVTGIEFGVLEGQTHGFGATHTPDVHGSVLQHDALPVHAGGKQDRRAVTDAVDRLLNGLVVAWHADGTTHALGEGAGPCLLGLVGSKGRAARAAQE